jgi:hypothetical protein
VILLVTPAEDVIQLACSADGCEKSPVLPNLGQKVHQTSLHMPIIDCFISDIPLVYGHKFATIFWGANWITPSKAGAQADLDPGLRRDDGNIAELADAAQNLTHLRQVEAPKRS